MAWEENTGTRMSLVESNASNVVLILIGRPMIQNFSLECYTHLLKSRILHVQWVTER